MKIYKLYLCIKDEIVEKRHTLTDMNYEDTRAVMILCINIFIYKNLLIRYCGLIIPFATCHLCVALLTIWLYHMSYRMPDYFCLRPTITLLRTLVLPLIHILENILFKNKSYLFSLLLCVYTLSVHGNTCM